MKRKNNDWSVTLDDEIGNNKLLDIFIEECNLKTMSDNTVDYKYVVYDKYGSYVAGCDNSRSENFKIPSQWKEAKEYICEEYISLEEGKWYKFNGYKFRVHTISDNLVKVKDLTSEDENYDEDDTFEGSSHNVRKESIELTKEELEEHLIVCAKARGFKEGVIFNTPKYKVKSVLKSKMYICIDGCLAGECKNKYKDSFIYHSKLNKWAEIVKEELPEINGYDGEFVRHYAPAITLMESFIRYGKYEFKVSDLFLLHSEISNSSELLKSLIFENGFIMSIEDLNKIIKYLESQYEQ